MDVRSLKVQVAGVGSTLKEARAVGGSNHEQANGGCIAKRKLPVLEMIEKETGVSVVGVSMDRITNIDPTGFRSE